MSELVSCGISALFGAWVAMFWGYVVVMGETGRAIVGQ